MIPINCFIFPFYFGASCKCMLLCLADLSGLSTSRCLSDVFFRQIKTMMNFFTATIQRYGIGPYTGASGDMIDNGGCDGGEHWNQTVIDRVDTTSRSCRASCRDRRWMKHSSREQINSRRRWHRQRPLYDEHGHLARKTQHETRTNEVNARRTRLVLGWATVFGRVYHLGM